MSAKVYIGCSGWSYASWRPAFYPPKTPLRKLLAAYAERLNAVEVNYTFRTLPSPSICAQWLAQTGDNFRFSPKTPQRVTHLLRLRGAADAMQAFAHALEPLQAAGRLGPALCQLPPNLKADTGLLDAFLASVAPLKLVTAWEFRDPSWFTDAVFGVLARHGAVLCAAESDTLRSPDVELHPRLRTFRLRRSQYTAAELDTLAEHFTALARGGADVYAFFKHEEAPDGPLRAQALLARLPAALRA